MSARGRPIAPATSRRRPAIERPGGGEPILEVDHLVKHFPIKAGILFDQRDRRGAGGRRRLVHRQRAARRWAWSASRAAASRPWPLDPAADRADLGLGRASRARRSPASKPQACARCAREMQMVFQDPYASLNPRKRIAQIVGDPMRLHGIVHRRRGPRRRSSELLETVGLNPEHYNRYPARVLGRPAPADRDRPGAVAEAEADHRRRAGLRPRRLDPGADHQPARGPPGASSTSPTSSSPTTSASSATSPTGSRSCTWARSSRSARPTRSTRNPIHPYTVVAALGGPDPRPARERRARADRARGRRAEPGEPAAGLPLPHPLPARDRDLLRGRAAADRLRQRPLGRLPPPRRPARSRRRFAA